MGGTKVDSYLLKAMAVAEYISRINLLCFHPDPYLAVLDNYTRQH